MEITEVRIFLRDEERLKAYVDIIFDNCFVLHRLRVVKLERGLRIFMPARKMADGTYKEIIHPITADFRKKLEEKILEAYERELSKKNGKKNGDASNTPEKKDAPQYLEGPSR